MSEIEQEVVKSEEEVAQEVNNLTAQEVIEKYLSDEGVKKRMREVASYFQERFNGNWFTLDKVLKKTPYKEVKATSDLLQFLILSSLACSKVEEGELKFKIVFDDRERVAILENEVISLEEEKAYLLDAITTKQETLRLKIKELLEKIK